MHTIRQYSFLEIIGRASLLIAGIVAVSGLSIAAYKQINGSRGPETVRVVLESQTDSGTTLIPLEQAIQVLANLENNNAASLYTELVKANCLLEKGSFVPPQTDEQGRVVAAPRCEKK